MAEIKLNQNEIIETCIKNLYNNKGRNSRREKNQNPGTMLNKVLELDVKIVGLYSKLPLEIKSYIDDKKSKHLFNTDLELRKKTADFILSYENKYSKEYCCFLNENARKALILVSNYEKTNFPINPRTWFNVSERQLCSRKTTP
jgi:hypothetical protein